MEPLMKLENIQMVFTKGPALLKRRFHVLKNINLTIEGGEIVAVVGESGCGKTTLGKIITGLLKPTQGSICFEGENVSHFFSRNIATYRILQFIQQDSYAALNPARTIYQSLLAPMKSFNKKMSLHEIDARIDELMGMVGLNPPEQFLSKYPHQLSGGQRQRILMARALTSRPKLIVADEPVSMIDVSLRLSILNLMNQLNHDLGISFIYITHDLSTARYIAKNGKIVVMYFGEIVETGPIEEVIFNPKHPYTQALIAAVPNPDPTFEYHDIPLKSMEMGPVDDRAEGCSFAPRCPKASPRCCRPVPYTLVNGTAVKCTLYGSQNDDR